jgi:predicted esterase
MELKKETVQVSKQARYYVLGEPGPHIEELWFVCHGYGQLAFDFLSGFKTLCNDRRLIVAPEALHRFYLHGSMGKVGASWMTREERSQEIVDYIRYLDEVSAKVILQLGPSSLESVRITTLGFSQGTATAGRWALKGKTMPHRLILWGGDLPSDIDWMACRKRLSAIEILMVCGDKDPVLSQDRIDTHLKQLTSKGIPFTFKRFDGYHEIKPAVLMELVKETGN